MTFRLALLAFFIVLTTSAWSLEMLPDGAEWNFRVYLDDTEIGYHNFRMEPGDDSGAGGHRVVSEASFNVKFLFFTAFRYRHSNVEVWQNDCLKEIESRTESNGKSFAVSGTSDAGGLTLAASGSSQSLHGCLKTFAYWDPTILQEKSLLNVQTGEVLPVTVERGSAERITVRDEQVVAQRYRLSAKGLQLDVWYTESREWVALESTVKGGRQLRYELI